MRKSLILTFDFPPKRGGISRSLWNVCRYLPPDRVVVLTEPSATAVATDVTVYRKKFITSSKLIWPRWLPLFWIVKKIVAREDIQLIQAAQLLPFGTVALCFKKLFHLPYIAYVYGQDLVMARRSPRKVWLTRHILKNAETVISNSHYTKKLAEQMGAAQERTTVVYPVPHQSAAPGVDDAAVVHFSEQHGLASKKVVLTVGNLVERKGQDVVIEALPLIVKKIPDIVYCLVGDGPRKAALLNKVARLHLENYVRFLGQVSEVQLLLCYAAAELFVMPSREVKNSHGETVDVEGFGLVYLEANLLGKPVIGGRSGGVPEAVEHGVSGLLVDPESREEIAEAIITLLQQPGYAQKLGEQGKKRVLDSFQWSTQMAKIKTVL